MTSVLIRDRGEDKDRRKQGEVHVKVETEFVAVRNADSIRSWKRQRKILPSLEPLERVQPCQHLDFRLLVFRTVRKYISVVLSHPAYCNVLQQF